MTLTVTKDGAPVPGVHVYFLQPNDAVAATVDTNAQGVASATVAAGGSVTALNPFPNPIIVDGGRSDEIRTFAGVKPGDHLVLTLTTTVADTVDFRLVAKVEPNANQYDVFTTCGTGSLSPGGGGSGSGSPDPGGDFSLDNCHGTADIAIVTRSFEPEGGTLSSISGLYHPAAALTETVDLRNDNYQELTDVAFTYLHPPDASINVQHFPVVAHGKLGPFSVDATGGTGTSPEPAITATSSIVATSLRPGSAQHDVVDWGPLAASYMLDLENLLLRDLIGSPQFNPTTRRTSWLEAPTGATADLTLTALDVTRFNPAPRSWHWEIVAPYTPGELTFPRLPTDVFDFTATADDSTFSEEVINAKVPGGYDAVRAHALDVKGRLRDGSDVTVLVTGAAGRALVVQTQNVKLGQPR